MIRKCRSGVESRGELVALRASGVSAALACSGWEFFPIKETAGQTNDYTR